MAVETKLQTEIISGFGVVQDGLKPHLEKLGSLAQNGGGSGSPGGGNDNTKSFNNVQFTRITDLIEKLISKVAYCILLSCMIYDY